MKPNVGSTINSWPRRGGICENQNHHWPFVRFVCKLKLIEITKKWRYAKILPLSSLPSYLPGSLSCPSAGFPPGSNALCNYPSCCNNWDRANSHHEPLCQTCTIRCFSTSVHPFYYLIVWVKTPDTPLASPFITVVAIRQQRSKSDCKLTKLCAKVQLAVGNGF